MIRILPILLALCLAAPAAAQPRLVAADGEPVTWGRDLTTAPLVYVYGDSIEADQRAAVEIALYRWQLATGETLAIPYSPATLAIDVLIDADSLGGLPDDVAWNSPAVGRLEHVAFFFASEAPAVALSAVLLLEADLGRCETLGPAVHAWGHLLGLDDTDDPRSAMTATPAGHVAPTVADAAAALEACR